MTHYCRTPFATVLFLLLCAVGQAQDGEKRKTKLDTVANPRLFDTLFSRYGFAPLKTLQRRDKWIRIRLPGKIGKKKTTQTGIYSYVSLAGNFTVEAKYFWGAVPNPDEGYGMSCGLALDTNGPPGMLALARNFSKDKGGSGYAVTRGKPDDDGKVKYDTKIFPTTAKKGRLSMRRENDENCVPGRR